MDTSNDPHPNRLGTDINEEDAVAWFTKCCLQRALPALAEKAGVGEGKVTKRDFASKKDVACVRGEEGMVMEDETTKSQGKSASPGRIRGDAPVRMVIREHCTKIFARLRARWGLSGGELTRELAGKWSEGGSPGKGGAKMYCCGNLLMKTMAEGEADLLKKILPDYLDYVEARDATMLPKFLMWVTISYKHGISVVSERLLVMNNVLASPHRIPTVYDLKGSSYGRSASPSPSPSPSHTPHSPGILKDNDLHRTIQIPQASTVFETLSADTSFLLSHNIVDYSLLLGIRTDNGEGPDCGIPTSTGNKEVYYIGIIDVLQQYTPFKKLETRLMGIVTDERMISAVAPDLYKTRFLGRAAGLLEVEDWEVVQDDGRR